MWCPNAASGQGQGLDERKTAAADALRNLGLVEFNGQWRFAEEPLLRRRLQQLETSRIDLLSILNRASVRVSPAQNVERAVGPDFNVGWLKHSTRTRR